MIEVLEQGDVLASEDPAPDETVDGEDEGLGGEESEQDSFLGAGMVQVQAFCELHRAEHDGYTDNLPR